MGARMKRIKRQFGVRFADALAQSPTLVADLEALRRKGIKIRKTSGCKAESQKDLKLISIGSGCTIAIKLLYLGHEAYHVLKGTTPDVESRIGRDRFVDLSLEEEIDCILHELQIASELKAAGYDVDESTKLWMRRFRRGGRPAMRRALNKTYASGTGKLYPQYYGRQWYEHHAA
jgi:hypothetical protein